MVVGEKRERAMRRTVGASLVLYPLAVILVFSMAGAARAQAVFFDDFNYQSSSDPALAGFGWTARTRPGSPGIGKWSAANITFLPDPADSKNRLMRMTATSSGTAATSIETEILTRFRFPHGTFAARVKFADAPASGPNGDQLYQTFFTISNGGGDGDSDTPYSELDFEYLPNGYGKTTAPHFGFTTWETPQKSVAKQIVASFAGWHTLLVEDADGTHVHYYVDGRLVATHSGQFYPTTPMVIDFNQWFPKGSLIHSSKPRVWVEQVDWVYFAKDAMLTTSEVEAKVAGYRSQGTVRLNTIFPSK